MKKTSWKDVEKELPVLPKGEFVVSSQMLVAYRDCDTEDILHTLGTYRRGGLGSNQTPYWVLDGCGRGNHGKVLAWKPFKRFKKE